MQRVSASDMVVLWYWPRSSPLSVQENIKGVPGGMSLKFWDEPTARAAYAHQVAAGNVCKVTITEGDTPLTLEDFNSLPGTDRKMLTAT